MAEVIQFEGGDYERCYLSRIKRIMNFQTDLQALVYCVQYCGQRAHIVKREQKKKQRLAKMVRTKAKKSQRFAKTQKESATEQSFNTKKGVSLSHSAEKKQVEKQGGRPLADFV